MPLFATLGLALASTLAGPAGAEDGPPKLDFDKTCKSTSRAEVALNNESSSLDGCLRSERQAEDDLKRRWHSFPAAAKKQCANQFEAGGYPSYVETLTCLELASDTVPKKADDTFQTKNARGSPTEEGEPSPKQRTDPLEVLHDKNK